MKKQPRINPAFDRAADKLSAWRNLQKVALDDQQRRAYDKLQFAHNDKLREHSHAFYEREPDLINEEKRRLLLQKPDLALRMLPSRPLKEARARSLAQRTVNARHELERSTMEQKQLEERDNFLRQVEQERAAKERAARQQQQSREKAREPDRSRPVPEPARDNQMDSRLAASLRARAAQKAAERDRDPDRER